MPSRPSSFQTPPNADSQDQIERLEEQLALVTKELNEMKAKARLGGYAGGYFNFLKKNSLDDARLKGNAKTAADKLRAYASGSPSEVI